MACNANNLYLFAPLPFVGQKRMFARHFIEVIKQYPAGTVFVDLFGGSGLLSHITKHLHPEWNYGNRRRNGDEYAHAQFA